MENPNLLVPKVFLRSLNKLSIHIRIKQKKIYFINNSKSDFTILLRKMSVVDKYYPHNARE